MAYHVSAEKRIRQTKRRTATNRTRLTRIRTAIKKVEAAISKGDKAAAQKALRAAQPEIMRGAGKDVLNKHAAARKMSRLAARVKALSTA